MDSLTGKLTQISVIEGKLTSTNSTTLKGTLSPINSQLIGDLVSLQSTQLVGTLHNNYHQVSGILSVSSEKPVENYEGEYIVTPEPFNPQTLETAGLKMQDDVVVLKIPYYETSNETGYTVYIGGE